MSVEQNKATERHIIDEMNKGNWGITIKFFGANFIYHGPFGIEGRGLNSFKESVPEFITAFPDIHMTIEDMIAEGDKVVTRWTFIGTHRETFLGIPPTEKQLVSGGICRSGRTMRMPMANKTTAPTLRKVDR